LGAIGFSTGLTGDIEGVAGAPHDGQNLTLAANSLPHFAQKGKSYLFAPLREYGGFKFCMRMSHNCEGISLRIIAELSLFGVS
jgi:hypothetical protein